MNPFKELLSSLAGIPRLRGARCRGKHHLFDPPADDEPDDVVAQRHSLALGLCGQCPAIADCEAWVDSLSPRDRPAGIVAGRLVRAPRTRREAS